MGNDDPFKTVVQIHSTRTSNESKIEKMFGMSYNMYIK